MPPQFQDSSIVIHKIKCGPYDNNAYLVVCPETNESILIDTPQDPGALIEAAKQTDVKHILITHNHFDHLAGFDEVTAAIGAPVSIGGPDAGALNELSKTADTLLKDGDTISAGAVTLNALATPGHTPGSTCFTTGDHLFSGDTLFPNGPGRTGSPENLKQLIGSINQSLFVLGDNVNIYAGHGDDGNLKTEKEKYEVFASKDHPADLSGDVEWLKS
ncbi:MAG: MBL fold metallo-hydrolase [SAR202 cluster bacterium]|jgi:glyoxylase-like metal-dependent hydrolase (beta-lactamase superfamily II)|nr:MBL fold metallo-hydrolase [SAR202 cluster bacterium]MDP6302102.1 MBL fold metallo-hydrolase [SAR202 cluster bacterium]MDP7104886.1 MBL fold metallo-hydrolase [SAR202 cluster bacterium]MDP7226592.1 MBL fold metallo-hydrolase [SAR202 cluster bacterium]MDP7532697.1 MBL fold metallo-hydrolase [SAR202 cluster bacterium]